ncbi:hypothetical protein SAMN05518861_1338 [Mesorhizobium sp. YR577]|nr:hypothetical protein SAMN05518861_1338 [Mesorhizobium sp. YR577]
MSPEIPTYKTNMMDVTQAGNANTDWREQAYDLTRGIAAYAASPLVAGLARVISKHPEADIANAFNHKQVACKMWARDSLFETCGGRYRHIWVLGGWYGVLPAMLFNDARFDIAAIDSIDIDPDVAAVAKTLNREAGDRFRAVTGDMYALDYASDRPDLVVNTSCEHIADLPAWLAILPQGTNVLLQSNDYFSEPTHINCVASLAAFEAMAALKEVRFSGELPTKNYTRFMLIGSV